MTAGGDGLLVVISGPSGVGKTTLADGLLTEPGHRRAVTATTRAPRQGEHDGVDYLFLDEASFRERIGDGRFLEHAVVHDCLYGTPKEHVEEILAAGDCCLLVIDVQGAASLRETGVEALYLFVQPPTYDELERRLRSRATDSPEAIERRLAQAREEMSHAAQFDSVVINDDVETAIAHIRGLVYARRSGGSA